MSVPSAVACGPFVANICLHSAADSAKITVVRPPRMILRRPRRMVRCGVPHGLREANTATRSTMQRRCVGAMGERKQNRRHPMPIDPQFIVSLKGKSYPIWAGVLDAATQAGLRSLTTHVLQIPSSENGHLAVVMARAEFEDGRVFE